MSDDDSEVDVSWDETAAIDRIRSVAETVSEPRPVPWFAQEAAVAERTTREHLNRLVEMAIVKEYHTSGATEYALDPLYRRTQALRTLIQENERTDLIHQKARLQKQIEERFGKYDVASPTALRERAADTETAEETRAVRTAAKEWDHLLYRISLIEDAIENYTAYESDR